MPFPDINELPADFPGAVADPIFEGFLAAADRLAKNDRPADPMTKPNALKPGDRIAVVSQSWGGPAAFPHIYEAGLRNLRELGLEPVEFPTARMDAAELYAHPELRARISTRRSPILQSGASCQPSAEATPSGSSATSTWP
jgi:hypothetical protein